MLILCLLSLHPGAINRSEFVFDDRVAVVQNADVTNITRPIFETIDRIRQHDFWGSNILSAASHKSYRPLITLMFNIEYRMYRSDLVAVYMKWMNLWLHCAVCCLLLVTLPKILPDLSDTVAWITTAMFAVHPIHTEAVCGIVGRADIMCALFYLLCINVHSELLKRCGWKQIGPYVILLILSGLGVLCKEIGITILVIWFIELVSRDQTPSRCHLQISRIASSQIFDRISELILFIHLFYSHFASYTTFWMNHFQNDDSNPLW